MCCLVDDVEIKKRNETAKYNFMTKNEYEINEIRKKDEKLKEKLFRQKEQTEKEETSMRFWWLNDV